MTYSYSPPPPADNKKLKFRIILVVAAVILLVVGLFVFRIATMQKGPPGGAGMGVPVMSENPKLEKTPGTVEAVGSLRADQSINLAPEVDGRIAAIPGVEGQTVKKGDVLVQLDQSIVKADMAEAEANLALTQATYGRTRNLATRQFATRQSEDEALSGLRQAQARAASARARLEKTTIEAPFDGRLGLRQKSIGAYVKAGEVIFPLTSVEPIFVDFRIPELTSAKVAPGQKVSVVIDALGIDAIEGEVTAVDPALDEAGRSLAVRAKLPNPEGRLQAGMFAHVTLAYGQPQDVLVVPERALFLRVDGNYVYRAVNGKAELAKVTVSGRRVGEVEIASGIQAGDDIITDGQIKLMPGAPVMLLSKPNLAPGKPGEKPPQQKPEEAKPVEAAPAVPAPEASKTEQPAPAAVPHVVPGAPAKTDEPSNAAPPAEAPPAAFVPAPAENAPASAAEKKE